MTEPITLDEQHAILKRELPRLLVGDWIDVQRAATVVINTVCSASTFTYLAMFVATIAAHYMREIAEQIGADLNQSWALETDAPEGSFELAAARTITTMANEDRDTAIALALAIHDDGNAERAGGYLGKLIIFAREAHDQAHESQSSGRGES